MHGAAHWSGQSDEARVKVGACERGQVPVEQLAALKVAVEEVAHHALLPLDLREKFPFAGDLPVLAMPAR